MNLTLVISATLGVLMDTPRRALCWYWRVFYVYYILNILHFHPVPYWIYNSSDIKNLNNYILDLAIYEQYSKVTILYRE